MIQPPDLPQPGASQDEIENWIEKFYDWHEDLHLNYSSNESDALSEIQQIDDSITDPSEYKVRLDPEKVPSEKEMFEMNESLVGSCFRIYCYTLDYSTDANDNPCLPWKAHFEVVGPPLPDCQGMNDQKQLEDAISNHPFAGDNIGDGILKISEACKAIGINVIFPVYQALAGIYVVDESTGKPLNVPYLQVDDPDA